MKMIDSLEVRLERRRYDRTFYCWAYVKLDGKFESLGDPWNKVTPSRKELADAIGQLIAQRSLRT